METASQNQSSQSVSPSPAISNQPPQPRKRLYVMIYFIIAIVGYVFVGWLTQELDWYSTARVIFMIYCGAIFIVPIVLAKSVFKGVGTAGKVLLGLGMALNLLLFLFTLLVRVD